VQLQKPLLLVDLDPEVHARQVDQQRKGERGVEREQGRRASASAVRSEV
jgi:hypothetical protein